MKLVCEVTQSHNTVGMKVKLDELTTLVFHRSAGSESMILRLTEEGTDAQWIVPFRWEEGKELRKQALYRPLVQIYRMLRREGYTERSLHYLVRGKHAERNAGYAITSLAFKKAKEEATSLIESIRLQSIVG